MSLVLPAILLLLAYRVWKRGGRERIVRVERMWILPLVFGSIIGLSIYSQPAALSLTFWVVNVLMLAFALGLVVGWLRGQTTQIAMDGESGQLKARMTPVGLVLIAALLLVRMSIFDWLSAHAAEWEIAPTDIVDAFLVFALGLVLGWRIEMFLRCRRLLAGAARSGSE